jgi:hypothetical protein
MRRSTKLTKKAMALLLHAAGSTVEEIARELDTHPSYIANVLAAAGKTPDYNDLYVSSTVQSDYARKFQGVLRFKDVESAQQSVRRIDALYRAFAQQNDRRGQHQAQLMALIGKNRAEGIGKYDEAQVFADWLVHHLIVQRPDLEPLPAPPADLDDASADRGVLTCATVAH